MTSRKLDYIPENLPPRAVTSEGVAWPPNDSEAAPWSDAHITVTDGEVMFAEQSIESLPFLQMRPRRSMDWFEVDAIVDTHFTNGWRCLVLLSVEDDQLYSVCVPWSHFLPTDGGDVDPFLVALAAEIADVATDDDVLTFPGNLDALLSHAAR